MKSERVEISVCGFECCMLDAKKILSWNKLRKMKCLCNRWVFVWNPVLWKRWSSLYTKCIQFCLNPLNFCTHVVLVKWWYHAKFQHFLSSGCSPLQFRGHVVENKSLKAWKLPNEVRKCWNFALWLWMLHVGFKKSIELK